MIPEELVVRLEMYGNELGNEEVDVFDAIRVNTMTKRVPISAASCLESTDPLARRP